MTTTREFDDLLTSALRFLGFLLLLAFTVELNAETVPPPNARKHWAFHLPRQMAPPAVKNARWVKTDIDRFILAKLEASGLSPSPQVKPRSLIRRMSFDLTGLPPSNQGVEEFTQTDGRNRDAAIAQLIGRLLASPRYDERWGRHWLDVARSSDTKGYVYAREERRFLHAPTYRDWVINAFNEDLPYEAKLASPAWMLPPPDEPSCPNLMAQAHALSFAERGKIKADPTSSRLVKTKAWHIQPKGPRPAREHPFPVATTRSL